MNISNKKTHFVTGTVGMIVTAALHIVISSLTGENQLAVWCSFYGLFLTFLILGAPIKKGEWS